MIEFGHGTHPGMARSRNEDTYYADPALGLFLVLDGMGGHRHGELASASVRDGVVERVTRGQSLLSALTAANDELLMHTRNLPHARPMGTTVAAVRLTDGGWEAAWVGDSRIYVDDGELCRLTHDGKLAEALAEKGEWPESRDTVAPRGVMNQALGVTGNEQLYVQMCRGSWTSGMRLLLCTDGLTEVVDDAQLQAISARTELGAQEAVEQMILTALDGGARDNVTAILVRHG